MLPRANHNSGSNRKDKQRAAASGYIYYVLIQLRASAGETFVVRGVKLFS